jgi:exodeoxyribonuclease VII large subunit
MPPSDVYSVSQFVATLNQIIEYGLPFVRIEGEVSGYRVAKGKWVSFRIRDSKNMVECFMGAWQLQFPLEDGMKIVVGGNPRLNGKYGKFSISVQRIKPAGQGTLDRAYHLLHEKLSGEGLFDQDRKQALPQYPERIGVISSSGAAGYGDFKQRLQARWPLAQMMLEDVLVQGENAASEIIAALRELNGAGEVDAIAIVRGGGAKEDLFAFNDESLIREIHGSRIPVVVGVGHKRDETLARLVADVGAVTPTHAAELIVPSAQVVADSLAATRRYVGSVNQKLLQQVSSHLAAVRMTLRQTLRRNHDQLEQLRHHHLGYARRSVQRLDSTLSLHKSIISERSPQRQLSRGFAIVSGSDGHMAHAEQLQADQAVTIRFDDGSRRATVQ